MSEVVANVKVKQEPSDWDYYSNFESEATALKEEIKCYNNFVPTPIKQEVKEEEANTDIHDCRHSTLSLSQPSKKQNNTTWLTKCEVCNKSFKDSNSFLKHIDAQRDSYCMKTLFPWTRNRTPNRYHPNNMFMCKTCKRRFFNDAGIRRHYTMQGGVCKKHLECRICLVSFETRTQVLKHVNTEHKTHKCDCCSAVFVRARSLNFHIISCHRNDGVITLVDCPDNSKESHVDPKNCDTNKIYVKAENMTDVKPEITPLDCETNIKTENVCNTGSEIGGPDPEPHKLQQIVPISRENIKIESSIGQLEEIVHACKHVNYGDQSSKKANNETLSQHYPYKRQRAVRNFKRYQRTLNNKYQETHQKFNSMAPMANTNIMNIETNQYEFASTASINMNSSSPVSESNWLINENAFTVPLINPMSFLMEPQHEMQEYYNLGGEPKFNNKYLKKNKSRKRKTRNLVFHSLDYIRKKSFI